MARVTLIIAFLVVVLVLANIALQAEPPRHVDPNKLQWKPPVGLEMLSVYVTIFTLIANLNFENASRNLDLIEEVSVPENLRYVASRVNSLLESIIRSLNETKINIDIAWGYFNRSSFKESWDWLSKAERSLRDARVSYSTLRDAVVQISMLGILVGRFTKELVRIEDAIGELEEEIEVLRGALTKVDRVTETKVTLRVNTTKVQVGGWIKVEGLLLDSGGAPLGGRSVVVHVGSRILRVLTDDSGFYKVTLRVEEYRRYVTVYAEFTPLGDDRFRYTYSKSEDIVLEIFYVTPRLNIALSKIEVLPLDMVTLVIETEPWACLRVKSIFINETLCTNSTGVTALNIIVDPMLAEGVYSIRVYVEPRGVMGPTSGSVQLKVYRLNPVISIKQPKWFIAGVPGEVIVNVDVESRFQLCIEGLMCSNGRGLNSIFKINIPITYAGESVKLTLVVEPLDLRFRATSLTLDIKVYNPIVMVTLIALTIVAIAMSTTIIARTIRPRVRPVESVVVGEVVEVRRTEGILGELALLLGELSELTSKLYGVSLEASDTLREYFLKLSTKAPKSLIDVLAGALRKIERILYGKPGVLQLEEILNLLKRIVDSLRGRS